VCKTKLTHPKTPVNNVGKIDSVYGPIFKKMSELREVSQSILPIGLGELKEFTTRLSYQLDDLCAVLTRTVYDKDKQF